MASLAHMGSALMGPSSLQIANPQSTYLGGLARDQVSASLHTILTPGPVAAFTTRGVSDLEVEMMLGSGERRGFHAQGAQSSVPLRCL